MSMERAIRRNQDHNVEFGEAARIVAPSEEQKRLTAEWLLPYQEAIVSDVTGIRKTVDIALRKDPEIRAGDRFWHKTYPEGRCGEIRDQVLKMMQTEMLDRSKPGLQALKNFVRQGGLVKKFWGIDNGKYFQNAIQVGDAILDVANDTVDRTKPPVVFYPHLSEAPIKNIETIIEFAKIAETYWEADIYPNIYFPRLAPVFPIVSIRPPRGNMRSHTLHLEGDAAHLLIPSARTAQDNHMFGLSSDFIFNSPYREKRLPEKMLSGLFESDFLKRLNGVRPDGMFRVSANPDEVKEAFAAFHFDQEMEDVPEEYIKDMLNILKYAERITDSPLVAIKE